MPYTSTGERTRVYIARCSVNNGIDCGKNKALIKRCFSEGDARRSQFMHCHFSPYHRIGTEEAEDIAASCVIEDWSEEEVVYENSEPDCDDEEDLDRRPAPPPLKRRNKGGKGGGRSTASTSVVAAPEVALRLPPRVGEAVVLRQTSPILMPPDQDDDQLVTVRRSQLKCIHDCVVRASHAARQAESIAERALSAFQSEGDNLERIARALGQSIGVGTRM